MVTMVSATILVLTLMAPSNTTITSTITTDMQECQALGKQWVDMPVPVGAKHFECLQQIRKYGK